MITYQWYYSNAPSEDDLKSLARKLGDAVDEITTELQLFNFLQKPWTLEMKNKYNHLIYAANKLNWQIPTKLVFETAKIKACLERLEDVYKDAETDRLV